MNRTEYRVYLRSDTWQRIKDAMWGSGIPKTCYGCGTGPPLNIHHRTYERVGGFEAFDDLMFLCPDCHKEAHDREHQAVRRGNPWGTTLWRAAEYVRAENKRKRPWRDVHDRRSQVKQYVTRGQRKRRSILDPNAEPR